QTQYRYYDSLVVASAIHAGASRLYSENLQHGRTIAGLEIINPFVDD
ncbi:MAG: putative nucleic acid-binding protein, partial [Candidatus Omnitrophota bacterium]